jgi:hypothetical protein
MLRQRRVLSFLAFLLLAVLFIPSAAAQAVTEDDGFVLQVNKPTTVAADEVMGGVVVINSDAIIDGRVKDTFWIVDDTGTVNGTVDGDVIVVNGTLDLGASAVVKNVTLVRSELNRADGAQITGDLNERSQFISFGWGSAIFSFMFWLGTTIVVLLAGMAFVAIGGRQLTATALTMTARPLESAVTALATWIALPILGVIAFITLIGIPLGLVIFLVLMPLLLLTGYIIVGQRLGMWLTGLANMRPNRYLPVLAGLLALQIAGLVPVLGGLLVGLAVFVGTGALVYHLYRDRRAHRPQGQDTIRVEGAAHA